MKEVTIEVAVSTEKVTRENQVFNLPTKNTYYAKNPERDRFQELFAIIPKGEKSFILVYVKMAYQEYNDFIPHDDCRQKEWLNVSGVRGIAHKIMTNSFFNRWQEVDKPLWDENRSELLDYWRKYESENLPSVAEKG